MRTYSGFRWTLALCMSAACSLVMGCGGGGSSTTGNSNGTGSTGNTTGTAAKAPDFGFKSATGGTALNYIAAGGKQSFTLTLSSVNGMPSPVTLSATAPTGWTVTFTPNNIPLPVGDTTITMTVTASPTAPPAETDSVLYKAMGGGLTRYYSPATFNPEANSRWIFQVNGVGFSVPANVTLASATGSFASTRSLSTGTGVTVVDAGGSGTFTPQVNGLPAGVIAVFDSPTTMIGGSDTPIDFTVISTGAPTPGSYPITISFSDGTTTHTSPPIALVVSPDASASNHLLVSGSTANTQILKNGPLAAPLRGQSYAQSVSFKGVNYNGEDAVNLGLTDSSKLEIILFGLPITAGQTYDFASAQNDSVIYEEGALEYYPATGTLTVNSITATTITLTFTNTNFQYISSVNGNPTGATGAFTLNGTVTFPLNQAN